MTNHTSTKTKKNTIRRWVFLVRRVFAKTVIAEDRDRVEQMAHTSPK